MRKNKEYIILENLPLFEKYKLVDINETTWGDISKNKKNDNKDIITIDRLYIKGINRISYNDRKIEDYSVFFKDYLSLGKKLFELSTTKNAISFSKPLIVTDIDIVGKYINDIKFYLKFYTKYQNLCAEVFDMINEIEDNDYFYENDKYSYYISNLLDKVYTIINFLIVLNITFNYDVEEELHALSDFLVDYHYILTNMADIKELKNINFYNLDELIKNIENIFKNNNFDLKQLVKEVGKKSKTGKYTNYVDLYDNLKFSPIDIKFTSYQLKRLNVILINWLKKYGFPYFVKKKDEKKYREKINIFSQNILNEEEYLLPCEYLVVNSIYNYIIYSLLIDQQEADPIIKKTFGFNNKLTANKRKEINDMRKAYNYYMNHTCDRIFDLKINSYNVDNTNNIGMKSDSYFKTVDGDVEIYINNLCIAANKIVDNETKYILLNNKKYCPICKKWKFPYDFKYDKYCSDKCQKIGNKKIATLGKRRRREELKLFKNLFPDDE